MMLHMTSVETHEMTSAGRSELYLTAIPEPGGTAQQQAAEAFAAIAEQLRTHDAHLLYERIFLTPGTIEAAVEARSQAYGDLDDGGLASWLEVAAPGAGEPKLGVQVHAVAGGSAPELIDCEGAAVGRIVRCQGFDLLSVAGLSAPQAGPLEADQAAAMLHKAKAVVEKAGGNLQAVSRTWMWLKDILDWYDDFNRVRNKLFHEWGLLGTSSSEHLPASTGIGTAPALGGHCTMDLVATIERSSPQTQILNEAGNQGAPFSYGSAFARAARARTPAGETVYVSGTASIDAAGNTVHLDDIQAQIQATITNVRAVLSDMDCGDSDVVHAVVYCATPNVQRIFNDQVSDLTWPRTCVIADVCRRDLLVEIEVTACPGAQRR
jgi:enamine deaminase RidA (YjgF/YER057c/UK114 family)